MDLFLNLILNGFSIFLLLILCFHSIRRTDEKTMQFRLYIKILFMTMFMLVLDTLSRADGRPDTYYSIFNHAGNFLLYLLGPVVPSLFVMYVTFQIYHDEAKTKKLILPLLALNAASAVMVVLTQFKGWYYFIDSNNIYHRGPYFIYSAIVIVFLVVAALIIIERNKEALDQNQLLSLMVFPLPPLVGVILQVCFYGISFVLNSVVLSLLIVLLNMKDDSIQTDYLTSIGNRKRLESVLKGKIKSSSANRTFSLIMLDIDQFKQINDVFGHEMGDLALKASAKLLLKNATPKDYVVRFGGDEFCLLLDNYDNKRLESLVNNINSCVDTLNASEEYPFNLKFTIGYAVYDYSLGLKPKEFIKQVDMLMYENKRNKMA